MPSVRYSPKQQLEIFDYLILTLRKAKSILWILKYFFSIHRGRAMKKINSINYGHKIISSASICLIVVPVICYFLWSLTKQEQFQLFAIASLVLGFLILLFLFVLLKIELYQDKKIAEYFKANEKTRVALKNGFYECQTCGNTRIQQEQKSCIICGTKFKDWSDDDGSK